MKLNGKRYFDMANKSPYRGNARFIELGTEHRTFRSLINVDHITNVRFEQDIQEVEAQYDENGVMTAPPQQLLAGWVVYLVLRDQGQRIAFDDEEQAVTTYNVIIDSINAVGVPIRRLPKLKCDYVAANSDANDGHFLEDDLPFEIPELTDEELDQLEHPEFDIDAIADAVKTGAGSDDDNSK
jgi:hypothetical protein